MKKTIFLLMCSLLTAGLAKAQKTFTFGPKIGIDYTHQWGHNVNDESALNYQAGAFFEYRFNNKISIAPELVFATHRTPKSEMVDGIGRDIPIDVTYSRQFNYINIPIMLKFYVTSSLSVDLGIQFGSCVYDRYTRKWEEDGKQKKIQMEIGANSYDFGFGVGLTYNITNKVFVQARYTLGLTKILSLSNSKNGNAQISLGYRF